MKDIVFQLLEQYIDKARAFVSLTYRKEPGYGPIIVTESGLHELTKEERGQLADALIDLAQQIRRRT